MSSPGVPCRVRLLIVAVELAVKVMVLAAGNAEAMKLVAEKLEAKSKPPLVEVFEAITVSKVGPLALMVWLEIDPTKATVDPAMDVKTDVDACIQSPDKFNRPQFVKPPTRFNPCVPVDKAVRTEPVEILSLPLFLTVMYPTEELVTIVEI